MSTEERMDRVVPSGVFDEASVVEELSGIEHNDRGALNGL